MEADSGDQIQGMTRLVTRVNPSQGLQRLIIEALNADAEPIDPRQSIVFEARALGTPRITLQGDLDIVWQEYSLSDPLEQFCYPPAFEQAWRAAPNENGVNCSASQPVPLAVEIAQQCLDIGLLQGRREAFMAIEVAVGAFASAPRQVNVKR